MIRLFAPSVLYFLCGVVENICRIFNISNSLALCSLRIAASAPLLSAFLRFTAPAKCAAAKCTIAPKFGIDRVAHHAEILFTFNRNFQPEQTAAGREQSRNLPKVEQK
jgi:hypothetical protein